MYWLPPLQEASSTSFIFFKPASSHTYNISYTKIVQNHINHHIQSKQIPQVQTTRVHKSKCHISTSPQETWSLTYESYKSKYHSWGGSLGGTPLGVRIWSKKFIVSSRVRREPKPYKRDSTCCKENGPRAIWLKGFWCLMINITCGLMSLLVFIFIVHRMRRGLD
jgi:hypothetical protein